MCVLRLPSIARFTVWGLLICSISTTGVSRAQDCNHNQIDDALDIDPLDADGNGMVSADCNADGIPDECVEALKYQYLKINHAGIAAHDRFGACIDMDAESVVVGTPLRYVNGIGIESGSAITFSRFGDDFVEAGIITPSNLEAGDAFGADIALSGDTMMIGASFAIDDCIQFPDCPGGVVYVYRRFSGLWTLTGRLRTPQVYTYSRFGNAIALDGDTAVIGAYLDTSVGQSSGSAFVFREVAGVWQQVAQLTPSDLGTGDLFGNAVAIEDGTAFVAARRHDGGLYRSGAVFVFREVGGVWQEIAKLQASDADPRDEFGRELALSGDTLIVSAMRDTVFGADSGSAYVFKESNGAWTEVAKLTGSHSSTLSNFGWQVHLDGDVALIAALNDPTGYSEIYAFKEIDGSWTQFARLAPDDADFRDGFGGSLATDRSMLLVGAAARDEFGIDSGAVYAFQIPELDCDTTNGDLCVLASRDCNENGLSDGCDMPGDVNGDGQFDIADVNDFVSHALLGSNCIVADISADGVVDGVDVVLCVNRLLEP